MVDRLERINKLQSFGLTENQAKAYLALLQLGQASASALNKLSGVPRNKVYSVVEELNEKGLVDVVLEDPIVFAPRPIAGFLDLLVAQLEDRRSELEEQKSELTSQFAVRSDIEERDLQVGSFRMFRGRRAVLHQERRMARDASDGVRAILSVHAASRMLSSNGVRDYKNSNNHAPTRVEVYTPLVEANHISVEQLHEQFGDAVRVSRDMPENLTIMMVDEREVMFTQFVPDSGSLTAGDDIGVWTDNPAFLALAQTIFQNASVGSLSVPAARSLRSKSLVPPHFEILQDAERVRQKVMEGLFNAHEIDVAAPAEDVRRANDTISAEERGRIQTGKRRLRVLSDLPPEDLAKMPWGPKTEVRHLDPLPARFTIFGDKVMRPYDLDGTGASLFGGPGTAVLSTDLAVAITEAKDHFERLWADGTRVETGVAARIDGRVPRKTSEKA